MNLYIIIGLLALIGFCVLKSDKRQIKVHTENSGIIPQDFNIVEQRLQQIAARSTHSA